MNICHIMAGPHGGEVITSPEVASQGVLLIEGDKDIVIILLDLP